MSKQSDVSLDERKLSIIDHLEELRFRILWSLLAIVIAFIPACFVAKPALNAFIRWTCPPEIKLIYLKPMELFFAELELSLLFAGILALPVISYQLWQFVAPGLYKHERSLITRFAAASTALFIIGVAFADAFVFPAIMRFSLEMETEHIHQQFSIDSFISLAICLSLGFGVMFQLPIVVCVLVSLGIVSLETMAKMRPLVVTVVFVLAALLTPPDIVSQLALGVPSWLLFELSLLFCRRLDKQRKQREAELAAEEAAEEAAEREREAQEAAERAARGELPAQTDETANADSYVEPEYPGAEETDSYYDYGITSSATAARVRNLTPGRHYGRRGGSRRRQNT